VLILLSRSGVYFAKTCSSVSPRASEEGGVASCARLGLRSSLRSPIACAKLLQDAITKGWILVRGSCAASSVVQGPISDAGGPRFESDVGRLTGKPTPKPLEG